jgi:hypothetical protein
MPPHNPLEYFSASLCDAEQLLNYAAESGICVDDATRNNVLGARATISSGWDEKTEANLLVALTKLAAQLKPVTAESLRHFNTKSTMRSYLWMASVLSVAIVLFSVLSFVSSAISQTIRDDIVVGNDMVLKLNGQIRTAASQEPAGAAAGASGASGPTSTTSVFSIVNEFTELQTLASMMRVIDDRAHQLNWFLFFWPSATPYPNDPRSYRDRFELPVPLTLAQIDTTASNGIKSYQIDTVATDWIRSYQDVRAFGQDVVDKVSVIYGAITSCILPVLYALLGACAFLLRSYSQEMKNRTFVPSHSDFARFLIAAIGGAVVGLFNNFTISQTPSISPLAIAFLVGYAVDVFFSFLEGMTQAFSKAKSSNSSPAKEA